MVLIDPSKAFDSISHDFLLQRLIKFDISLSAIKWLKSYVEERFQSVRIENHLSEPKLITHGVPQGSILGPLLFSLYINDLPTISKFANTESYVDDTKLFMSMNWNNLDNGLKELKWDLDNVAGWCCWNKLLINPEKTKFIIFGTRQQLKNPPDDLSIQFLGESLTPSKSVKDLGVTLDRELTFDEHINNVVKCCNCSLCQISRVRHLFNKEHIEVILNSLVFSKLYFSSTVWSNTTKRNAAKLQQVQNFAARIVDNKKKFEHITPTLKALKWLPVSDKLVLNDAIMTYKCMNGQAPSYLCSRITNMCEQTHRYNTRFQSSGKIKQQLCRTSTGQRSFLVRAIDLWNYSIDNNIHKENLLIFKKEFKMILMNKFLDS